MDQKIEEKNGETEQAHIAFHLVSRQVVSGSTYRLINCIQDMIYLVPCHKPLLSRLSGSIAGRSLGRFWIFAYILANLLFLSDVTKKTITLFLELMAAV